MMPSQKARSECDELLRSEPTRGGGGGVAFRWEPGGIEAQKARPRATRVRMREIADWEDGEGSKAWKSMAVLGAQALSDARRSHVAVATATLV